MRKIGIIGGMSAESTAHYYAAINDGVRQRLGGLHSAEIILWSVDFAVVAEMQADGRWDEAGTYLAGIAKRLETAGAEVVILATNTMHKVADAIIAVLDVPFIHLADATAQKICAAGLKRPGLMATRYTMEEDFYVGRLQSRFGLDVIVPNSSDRTVVHGIIYDELCKGVVTEVSRADYMASAARLVAAGADCLILGCTEVGMLIKDGDLPVPVFDTTQIHAEAAVELAAGDKMRKAAE
jgi:aspartate racemase